VKREVPILIAAAHCSQIRSSAKLASLAQALCMTAPLSGYHLVRAQNNDRNPIVSKDAGFVCLVVRKGSSQLKMPNVFLQSNPQPHTRHTRPFFQHTKIIPRPKWQHTSTSTRPISTISNMSSRMMSSASLSSTTLRMSRPLVGTNVRLPH
jgi:hypothetical protein